MISTTAWALAILLASTPLAQDEAKRAGSAKEAYDLLVKETKEAGAAYSAKVRALMDGEEWAAAREANDNAKLDEMYESVPKVDYNSFASRALNAADSFDGDEVIPLLSFAIMYSRDKELTQKVVDRILADHLKSPALVTLLENGGTLGRAIGPAAAGDLLADIAEHNQDPMVQAWAMYWQASTVMRDRNASADAKERAEAMLAKAEQLAAGTLLADRIAAPRFEEERLQVGMEAPDIAGVDTDGTAFKLSDYRGKVVVLDFWGFW